MRAFVAGACLLIFGSSLSAQTPEEHASHHPDQKPASQPAAKDAPSKKKSGPGMGGMMGGGGMGGMMKRMGAPPPRELYPELMRLPDLPPEEREAIRKRSQERMAAGVALMDRALEQLGNASKRDDFAAMQVATQLLREGVAEFDSGLAAHRALAEGKAPRKVALQWFRKHMNLESEDPPPQSGVAGLSWFHISGMAVLTLLAGMACFTYISRMRRAEALVTSLAGVSPPEAAEDAAPPAETSPPISIEARPARSGPWSGSLQVIAVYDETPDVKTFRLSPGAGVPLPFTYLPGQFLTLKVQVDDKPVKRSYTIASSPAGTQSCEITVKKEPNGLVSRHLHDRWQVGTETELKAPQGKFTFTGVEAESVVLIGGGVGITPLMSVLRWLCDTGWPGEIYLLYSCRNQAGIIFREELQQLERRHPRLSVTITLTGAESGWDGQRGRIDGSLLSRAVPNWPKHRIHICGPPAFLAAIPTMLEELGVPGSQIKTEAFGAGPKRSSTPPAKTPAASAVPTVTFQPGNKSGPLPPDATVLDVADQLEIEIDNSCRSGTCGTCKVRLKSGEVSMECEDALEPEERQQGLILACQARATGNLEVELLS